MLCWSCCGGAASPLLATTWPLTSPSPSSTLPSRCPMAGLRSSPMCRDGSRVRAPSEDPCKQRHLFTFYRGFILPSSWSTLLSPLPQGWPAFKALVQGWFPGVHPVLRPLYPLYAMPLTLYFLILPSTWPGAPCRAFTAWLTCLPSRLCSSLAHVLLDVCRDNYRDTSQMRSSARSTSCGAGFFFCAQAVWMAPCTVVAVR